MTSDNAILNLSTRAAELRAAGREVIVLAAGEPDSPPHPEIIAAAKRAIDEPANHRYGDAAGWAGLREHVATEISTRTGCGLSADAVQVTMGVKHALALAVAAITEPGDEVLVPSPGWPGHTGAVESAGAVARPVRLDPDRDFRLTVDDLESARTANTRAVVLASPGNPTGQILTAAQLMAIARWADEHDVWIISDEIYRHFHYVDQHQTLLEAAPEAASRSIIVDGVSKTYAMTGWRVGWLIGPPEVVMQARSTIAKTITHVPHVSQAAALAALELGPQVVQDAHNRAQRTISCATAALDAIPGVHCPAPDGGMYVLPDVRDLLGRKPAGITSTIELAEMLLDEAGVAVVPGEMIGAPGFLRICVASDEPTIEIALKNITTALTSLMDEGR